MTRLTINQCTYNCSVIGDEICGLLIDITDRFDNPVYTMVKNGGKTVVRRNDIPGKPSITPVVVGSSVMLIQDLPLRNGFKNELKLCVAPIEGGWD